MKKTVIIVLAILVVAAGAFALVKSNSDKSPASSNGTSSSNNTSDNPVTTDKVAIGDNAFSPAAITVKKGTTVTWTNNDAVSHTVTGDESGNMDSDTLAQGDSYKFTFDKTGTFNYHCNFHSGMTGQVIVTE